MALLLGILLSDAICGYWSDSVVGKVALGKGVRVRVDAEMAEDVAIHPDEIELAFGGMKRSRKTVISEAHVECQAMVQVTYSGLLAKSGAQDVYLHYGYGPGWRGGGTIPMQQSSPGKWAVPLVSLRLEDLNFCFVDGMGNWDNNADMNWSFVPDRVLSH